jgi:hypothetical protein
MKQDPTGQGIVSLVASTNQYLPFGDPGLNMSYDFSIVSRLVSPTSLL